MGITIHYDFVRRRNPKELLEFGLRVAKKLGWKILENNLKENKISLHPHENCESVDLEFQKLKDVRKIEGWALIKTIEDDFKDLEEEDFVCVGFCKTQYAGSEVHIFVAEFLRMISAYCHLSSVSDEGEYYENLNKIEGEQKLKENFDESSKMISNIAGTLKDTFGKENVYMSADNLD